MINKEVVKFLENPSVPEEQKKLLIEANIVRLARVFRSFLNTREQPVVDKPKVEDIVKS
jgi:hypothetical protein